MWKNSYTQRKLSLLTSQQMVHVPDNCDSNFLNWVFFIAFINYENEFFEANKKTPNKGAKSFYTSSPRKLISGSILFYVSLVRRIL